MLILILIRNFHFHFTIFFPIRLELYTIWTKDCLFFIFLEELFVLLECFFLDYWPKTWLREFIFTFFEIGKYWWLFWRFNKPLWYILNRINMTFIIINKYLFHMFDLFYREYPEKCNFFLSIVEILIRKVL